MLPQWKEKAALMSGKRAYVSHNHYNYLLRWLGIVLVNTLEPIPGKRPDKKYLTSLVLHHQKSTPIDIIACGSLDNPRYVHWVAKRGKIPFAELPFTVGSNSSASDTLLVIDNIIDILSDTLEI